MTTENEIPVNAKTLATTIQRSTSYVCAMKAAGYKFTHGNRTLVSDALAWLAANPDFRSTSYHRLGALDTRVRQKHASDRLNR